jgi:small-conductance mechanosensitive channel
MDLIGLAKQFVTPERITLAFRVLLILVIGIPLVKLIRRITARLIKDRLSAQSEQLIIRTVYYLSILILLISVLNEFGFKLSALLGAAGVFGIAIGFASQTSVSNIISGIFLISEKPFVVGDYVQVSSTIGSVESIDLLSIKLKTPDNRYVRLPNETMIKSEVVNITRFPLRRVNIDVSVAYKEDLTKVLDLLKQVAAEEPLALQEPAPVTFLDSFGDSGINILFGVWGKTEDYFVLKTSLMISVKQIFDREKVEIPFPHVSLITGSNSESIKITPKEENHE